MIIPVTENTKISLPIHEYIRHEYMRITNNLYIQLSNSLRGLAIDQMVFTPNKQFIEQIREDVWRQIHYDNLVDYNIYLQVFNQVLSLINTQLFSQIYSPFENEIVHEVVV